MEKTIINPASQRVVVLPEEQKETKTASGIIIPGHVEDEKPGIGLVVAVGQGEKGHPMEYCVGQRVIYSQFAGLNVKLNLQGPGENVYKVMNQLDIMATIQNINQ